MFCYESIITEQFAYQTNSSQDTELRLLMMIVILSYFVATYPDISEKTLNNFFDCDWLLGNISVLSFDGSNKLFEGEQFVFGQCPDQLLTNFIKSIMSRLPGTLNVNVHLFSSNPHNLITLLLIKTLFIYLCYIFLTVDCR